MLHTNKPSFSHFCILYCVLCVHSIVTLTQYPYITPDGSLAPLLICNMFMGPAGIHTRACRQAFDLAPLLGLLKRVSLVKLVQPGCIQLDLLQVWWGMEYLWFNSPHLSKQYVTPGTSCGTRVVPSGRAASIHEHLCNADPGIVSLCRPPVLRNASGCQLLTAFHILTPSNSLQRQMSPYTCAICYTVESECSDVYAWCY